MGWGSISARSSAEWLNAPSLSCLAESGAAGRTRSRHATERGIDAATGHSSDFNICSNFLRQPVSTLPDNALTISGEWDALVLRYVDMGRSLPSVMQRGADPHRDHEHEHPRRQSCDVLQGRSRAKPDQTPPDPKHDQSDDQIPIDVSLTRPEVPSRQDWFFALSRQGVAETAHDERYPSRDREARVPRAEYIEKAQHLCRLHHTRDQQAPAEHEAAEQTREQKSHGLASQSVTREGDDDNRGDHKDRRRDHRAR